MRNVAWLIGWLAVVLPAAVTVSAAEPLARWRVTVDLGADRGQAFGSLFEARDAAGQLVAGAGFSECYNTRFRGDRHTLQFFVRPAIAADRFQVERLPHPDMDCGVYLYDFDQRLFAWTSARRNRVKAWDPRARQWVEQKPTPAGPVRSGDGIMKLGGGRLTFIGNRAWYNDRLILEPPAKGRYYNYYYALGRLFFFHTVRDGTDPFTRIHACRWTPDDPRPIDLERSVVQQAKYVGATPFCWGQFRGEVLTVTNQGGIHAFTGKGRWRTLQQADNTVSYQVYSMLNYFDRQLLAQYPTGHLFEFRGGDQVRHLDGWPPRFPGVSDRAREAQTTAIYRGELFVGVWPWAELWRYDRDVDRWHSMGRMFTHPELTDRRVHPYEAEADRFKLVSNHWGQRVTGLVPIAESLYLSTSSKGTYEWYDKYDFLTDKQRREYGAVLKLTMTGNLAASIAWTGQPLALEFAVERDRIVIRQDGRQIGSARLADGGGRDFSKTVSHWGTGAFGPLNGRLIKRDAR